MILRTVVARLGRGAMVALRRPWVSIVLVLALLLDSCSLPASTTIGRLAPAPRCRCCCFWWPQAMVVQDGDRLRLIDMEDESAANMDERSIVATLDCNPRRRVSGFWAATREWWDPAIRVSPWSRSLTASELGALRPQFADIVKRGEWSSLENYADLMRAGAGPYSRMIFGGYVHNAISLMLASMALLSLGWIRDRLRARRARWALIAGLCPSCRYDLRGEMHSGCPECGWRRQDSAPDRR